MKIRPSILLFCAASVLMIILVVWFAKRPKETPIESSVSRPQNNVTTAPPQSEANTSVLPANPPVAPPIQATNAMPDIKRGEERLREILATQNDMPIVFYGKLEDQFENPVVGAQIAGNVIINRGEGIKSTNVITTSDASGFFTMDAGNGESIGIVPKKEGYALATTGTEFKYSHRYQEYFVPDQNNPVVIKMWKLQGAEPLVGINCEFKLYYTNTPIYFDLISKKIVPLGGDIKITVNRTPGIISGQNRLDWNVEIEAVDGGLMDSTGTERITYFAPEGGYQPSRTVYSTDRLPEGGLGGFHADFYVKSRNGQVYSKLSFSFGINLKPDDPVYIGFSGLANTNGSRNWEGDPNTMIAIGQ
jgi:hypothetical protein